MDEEATTVSVSKHQRIVRQKILAASLLIVSILAGIAVSFIALRRDLSVVSFQDVIEASSMWFNGWYWMLGAIVCLLVILVTGALRIYVLLKAKKQRVTLRDSYRYSILSKYYVLITPLGLGGQPITMIAMRKKKIPFGLATFVPMIDLFAMRLAMLVLGLITISFFPNVVVSWVRITAYVGLFFTCLMPVIGISLSWLPIFEKVVIGLLRKLRFLKRQQQFITVTQEAFKKYRTAFGYFRGSKKEIFLVVLLALASQLALLSIPFFLLKAYPNTALISALNIPLTYTNTVAMVAYASIAVAFIPTVGNAGAIEFSFSTVFSSFMEGRYLFWAMFAWRFLTFYIFLVLGVILTFYLGINRRKESRRHHIPDFNEKLRVVLFSDNFYPMVDGVIKTVDAYARHLLAQGYQPLVIVPNYKRGNEKFPYQVLRVPSLRIPHQEYALGIFPFSRTIRKALQSNAPMIYHTHAPFMIGQQALRHARANNIPIVTTFHSKYYEDFYENTHSKAIAQWGVRKILRFYRRVDEVWAVSRKTSGTLRHYGYRGDIHVMPNGSDFEIPQNLASHQAQAREFLKIKDDEPTLLFVGHLIWQKNIKLILSTLEQLDKLDFHYHMIFVGEGGHEKMVRKYAESLNLHGRVTFAGLVKEQALLAGIYATCDLFFFPSVYDNAPLVIREAAALGLPSLLIRGSHSSEIIVDNISGFVEREDKDKLSQKIISIFSNRHHLKEVGDTARATIPMGWDIFVGQAIERYQQIIERYYHEEE